MDPIWTLLNNFIWQPNQGMCEHVVSMLHSCSIYIYIGMALEDRALCRTPTILSPISRLSQMTFAMVWSTSWRRCKQCLGKHNVRTRPRVSDSTDMEGRKAPQDPDKAGFSFMKHKSDVRIVGVFNNSFLQILGCLPTPRQMRELSKIILNLHSAWNKRSNVFF